MMLNKLEIAKGKVEWADRKCDEAAASDAPWALANLRLYQNYGVKFYREYAALARSLGIEL